MPKKIDHHRARAELAKVAPDVLRAFSVRLPAGLLIEVHRWAEEKNMDLTTAIRELTALGLEAATRPEAPSPADRKAMKKWEKEVERALRTGLSPFQPFLERNEPDAKPLAGILGKMDYQTLYEEVKAHWGREEPLVERRWQLIKRMAPALVTPLMEALDRLEERFLARKQYYSFEDGDYCWLRWLLSDTVMQALKESPIADADIQAVKQLIDARYLVNEDPNKPWQFLWEE